MGEIINYVGAGLAVGIAGIGVAIGQGFLAKASTEVIGKRKDLSTFFLTVTILGIALVESAAIYGLIVGFKLLSTEALTLNAAIGAGLAIGLTGAGAGLGEGLLVSGAIKAMDKNPGIKTKLITFMVLFVALTESAAIYGLVVAFNIMGDTGFASQSYIGMGLAIGFSGLGIAVGQGLLAKKSLEAMSERQDMSSFLLTTTILGIALVESAAIYGLVVAMNIGNLPIYAAIGSGLAIGLTGLGAGIGEGILVSGAMKAIIRNPHQKTKIITFMVLFVALAEVTAIYGLIIYSQIMASVKELAVDSLKYVGAGFSVGLAGLGVAIGIGLLSRQSLEIMGKNPRIGKFLLTVTILGIALLESAVIYGLVVSFQILSSKEMAGVVALGKGLAIGLAGLGAGIGEGLIVKGAMEGMNKDPDSKSKILAFMVLFVALVEVVAIYGLIIALKN